MLEDLVGKFSLGKRNKNEQYICFFFLGGKWILENDGKHELDIHPNLSPIIQAYENSETEEING